MGDPGRALRALLGVWDDVYASWSGLHGYVRSSWQTTDGSAVHLRPKGLDHIIHFVEVQKTSDLLRCGVNFVHQSTTGMSHTITNGYDPKMTTTYEKIYFSFRRRFLTLLEKAGRPSPSFHATLLSWRHSGFSVDASQRVAVGAVRDRPDGKVEIDTPLNPRTGARVKVLDRLDFIHAVCQQIPDPRLHQTRHYGAYSCKRRKFLREARAAWEREETAPGEDEEQAEALLVPSTDAPPPATLGSAEAWRRQSWARMLRKVFEVDPLVCPRCGEEMVIIAWITRPDVVDRILRHRREKGLVSPFEP